MKKTKNLGTALLPQQFKREACSENKNAVQVPLGSKKILVHMSAEHNKHHISIHSLIDKKSIHSNCLFIWNGLENKVEKLIMALTNEGDFKLTPPKGFVIKEVFLVE